MLTMSICAIVSGGRNGSLFFQSLLDGHPQIMQFPGVFYAEKIFELIENGYDAIEIGRKFITLFPEFFDSRNNDLHRMNMLGDEKNEFFSVSETAFLDNYNKLVCMSEIEPYGVIYALHVAYFTAVGDNKLDEKILMVIHVHHAKRLKKISKYVEVIPVFMERNPIPSLQSELDHRIEYAGSSPSLLTYLSALQRKVMEPYRVSIIYNQAYAVRLEDLHRDTKKTFDAWCSVFGLTANDCLYSSIFHGLRWWGDALSPKPLNGVNPSFTNNLDSSKFYRNELQVIECVVNKRAVLYGYKKSYTENRCVLMRLMSLSKYELLILKMRFRCFFRTGFIDNLVFIADLIRLPYLKYKMIIEIRSLNNILVKLPMLIDRNVSNDYK